MEIITEQEMAERLNYRAPLKPEPEQKESMWCIPFEYGSNVKGTRISVSKAKEIAAELRAEVAEAEKRELFRVFKREEARAKEALAREAARDQELAEARGQIAELTRRLRAKRKRT